MSIRLPRQSITCLLLGFQLLLAGAASAQPHLLSRFAGFDDVNANGILDCGEPVTVRTGFFTGNSDTPELSGKVFLPSSGTLGLLYLPGSLQVDLVTIPSVGCLGRIVRGNDPGDSSGEVEFTCAADPSDVSAWVLSLVYKAIYYNASSSTFTVAAHAVLDDGTPFDASDFQSLPPASCAGTPNLIQVEKSVQGSGAPGTVLLYTITAFNPSSLGAGGVQLTDTVPDHAVFNAAASSPDWVCPGTGPGSLCRIAVGNIPSGGAVTRFFAVTLDSPLPAGVQSVANTACAREGPSLVLGCGSVSTPTTGRPVLSTTKILASGTAAPGATLVYSVAVANVGNQGAGTVTLAEAVPPNTTFATGSSTPGWTCAPGTGPGSTCTFNLPSLAAGATAGAQFALTVDNPLPAGVTSIANTACAQAPGEPADCSKVTTPTDGRPSLNLTKTVSGPAVPGGLLTYTLHLQNVGNQGASSITLSEAVPDFTSFAPGASSPGWTCSPSGDAGSACTLTVPTLAAGAAVDLAFAVQVMNPLPAGATEIGNSACASAPGLAQSCDAVTTPTQGQPQLELAKTLDGDGVVRPGTTLSFRLTVTNSGNQDAGAVRLTETVPPLARFSAAASTAGWTCTPDGNPGASCTFNLPALEAGTSREIVFALRADDALPANATILNAACAEIPDSGLTSCATVETQPALSVASTLAAELLVDADASGNASPGDTLRYTLKVPNATSSTLLALVAVPDLDPFTRLIAGSVHTDHGTVTTGNGSSDVYVSVALGSLGAGETATVTFDALITDPLPTGLTQVSAQALVRGDNIPEDASDDPATPEPDDPTVTPVFAGRRVNDVPALDHWGLGILIAGLLGAGTALLRR